METQVLVVGAGPTGLLLACELARHGCSVHVVEKRAARSRTSKALAVHARTLEVWEDMGVLAEALRRGRRVYGMNLYAGAKRLAHVSLDELESPYPFVLVLPQSETEAILEARAQELGVSVEREAELLVLSQDADGVHCTVRRGAGGEQVQASYVVGCDGAHSTVRSELGIEFRGVDVSASFVFADARLEGELADDEVHTWFAPAGPSLCIPLPTPGMWRVIVALPDGEERDGEPELSWIEATLRERTTRDLRLSGAIWRSGFDVRQRKVDRYRAGRVFLAGDAAHCHSPIGGQGMNTGLQDAYNLAWKLALVARGEGTDALLDSYGAEREPVATELLRLTERGTRVVTLRNPIAQALRNQVGSFLTGLDVVQQRLARQVGELSVNYRRSPLVGEHRCSVLQADLRHTPDSEKPSLWDWGDFAAGPRPGERVPDALYETPRGEHRLYELLQGTTHVLLLFDGAADTPEGYVGLKALVSQVQGRCGARVRTRIVVPHAEAPEVLGAEDVVLDSAGLLHRAFRAGAECLYLIRPDGYLAYRAQPVEPVLLLAFLDKVFV